MDRVKSLKQLTQIQKDLITLRKDRLLPATAIPILMTIERDVAEVWNNLFEDTYMPKV